MANSEPNGQDQKYGVKNCLVALEGDDIVIRVSTKDISHNRSGAPCLAGTPNPTKDDPEKKRAVNLVGSSAGFTPIAGCLVSVNVTS
jgi:hypothetical protein